MGLVFNPKSVSFEASKLTNTMPDLTKLINAVRRQFQSQESAFDVPVETVQITARDAPYEITNPTKGYHEIAILVGVDSNRLVTDITPGSVKDNLALRIPSGATYSVDNCSRPHFTIELTTIRIAEKIDQHVVDRLSDLGFPMTPVPKIEEAIGAITTPARTMNDYKLYKPVRKQVHTGNGDDRHLDVFRSAGFCMKPSHRVWERVDDYPGSYRSTLNAGPSWSQVIARISIDEDAQAIIE